jgi:hypothetical protein
VIGDCKEWTVRAITSDGGFSVEDHPVAAPSESVISMLEQFGDLHRMNSNSDFLISFLEDRLGGILGKSQTLVELVTAGELGEDFFSNLLDSF